MFRNFIYGILIALFFIQGFRNSNAQGIDNIWIMGYDTWAGPPWGSITWDFSINPVSISLINRKMCFRKTNASISNTNGNILFYTNGIWIANSTNDTMQNGSGLNPGYLATQFYQDGLPLAQGTFIVPIPDDSNKYYIIHQTVNDQILGFPSELMFSKLDMALDNGLGGLIAKNVILFGDTLTGYDITGAKHGNGRDWWIISHKLNSDIYFKNLITPFGISDTFNQRIGISRVFASQAAFSPDATKYASYNVSDDLEIFDFDRCSGLFSNYIHVNINDSAATGGLAFSPSGRFVYVSSLQYIYQFDLLASNVPASMKTIAVWDGTYSPWPPFAASFFLMQLAKDGKIYINCPNSTLVMHVINFPDSVGLSCDFQQHIIQLPAANGTTIPNYSNYFLGRDVGSPCDSLTPVEQITTENISLTINPNPAKDKFYINYNLPSGINADLRIYNTLGKEVMHKKLYWYFGYLQIDASDLNAGMYFIKVKGKGIGGNAKVVVMK